MHDTLTPLGGMIPLLHMMLNSVFGGLGVGLMNMLIYAVLTVFICGLMVDNGSGFEGLADNSYFWNITTGLAMFFGRSIAIIAQLAIAGSLLAKKRVAASAGTMRTDNVMFTVILVFIVYIFAALTFFPALALGPVAEHLTLWF